MTACCTGATIRVRLKYQRKLPVTVGDHCSYMCLLFTGVELMTGTAGSALHFFVDVKKVKVQVSIPKISQGGGPLFQKGILRVTLETEIVFLQIKRCIKILREITDQAPKYIGPVRIVAGNTIILLNGPVSDRVLLHDFRDVS
jgi:hypothetical protein